MERGLVANLTEKRLGKEGRASLAGTRGCEFAALLLRMLVVRPDCFRPRLSRVRFRFTMLTRRGPLALCSVKSSAVGLGSVRELPGAVHELRITRSRCEESESVVWHSSVIACQRRRSFPLLVQDS